MYFTFTFFFYLTFSIEANKSLEINNPTSFLPISTNLSYINEIHSFSEQKDSPLRTMVHYLVGFIIFCLCVAFCCGCLSARCRMRNQPPSCDYSSQENTTETQVVVAEPIVLVVQYQKQEAVIIQNDKITYLRYDELKYDN